MLIKYEGIPQRNISIDNFPEYLVNLKALINIIWVIAISKPDNIKDFENTSIETLYIYPNE